MQAKFEAQQQPDQNTCTIADQSGTKLFGDHLQFDDYLLGKSATGSLPQLDRQKQQQPKKEMKEKESVKRDGRYLLCL